MLFDLKSYRQALYPLWKQKKLLRVMQEPHDDMASEIEWMYEQNQDQEAVEKARVEVCAHLIASCEAPAHAQEIPLKASWYSIDSLKKEGTYKYSKGVMANGHIFSDNGFTCATRIFPLGALVRVTNRISKSFVVVKVTDRIGKRFGKTRVDLSKSAFQRIANLNSGLANVTVERIY